MSTPQSQFDISDIAEPPPSPPARARSSFSRPAAVNPQLDSFVNDVISEASRRTGYTYKLGEGVRTPDEQARKVAQGYSKTYDSKHLTGSARDVLAFDENGNYIRDGSHPAYQALGDVYRERAASAGVPVKWGGDFRSFHDPGHFELGAASTSISAVPKFDISDIAEPESKFDISDIAEPTDDEVVSINAARSSDAAAPQTLPPLSERQSFDLQTEEGRQARDERNTLERTPGARAEVAVPLPQNLEGADTGALVRDAYKTAALARGVTPEFFDKWVSTNVPGGYSLHDAKGNQLTIADTMTPDAYDERNHSVRLRLDANHLSKIIDDYNASKGALARASDWAASGEESPGEKVLDVARPGAQAAGYVLDKAGRVVGALSAAEWSQLRGTGEQANSLGAAGTSVGVNPKGAAAVLAALEGDEVPEYARNPIGEAARNSTTLANINPRLPALAGAAGDLVDPLSLVPIEGVGELAEGGRLGRAAEGVGDAARGAGLLDRGMVEARPLGLEEAGSRLVAGGRDVPRAPETLSTLSAQVDAMKAGRRSAVLVTPGEVMPAVPRGYVLTPTERGVFIHDPAVVTPAEVGRSVAAGTHGELLGHVTPGDIISDRVVVARRPGDGLELQASYATPETAGAQAAELRRQFPGAEVEAGGPELERGVIEDRAAASGATPPADSESLRYARERRQFYAEQAATAKDPVARQAAQANADSYAADVARMEGRELHHSELQPRTDAGQFDGPPRSLPRRALDAASDVINAPKSIKSSLALHGPFRQGVFQAAAHPTFLREAIGQQVRAFASEDAFRDFAQSLAARPWYQPMTDAGLFLPSTYDAAGEAGSGALLREERFASRAAEKILGVRASGRAYLAAMDSIRAQAVETYLADMFGSAGADLSKADPRALKAVAEMVNVTTGRGVVPVLDRSVAGRKIVAALNNPFWSPRAMASRFNLISPYRLTRNLANPATRQLAVLQLRDSTRALTTLGATAGLLSLVPGVKVGLNPYARGWGKVAIGETSYDLVDGVPSTARYAAQMARSFYLKAAGRRVPARVTPAALTRDFLRRRLSPSGQVVADYSTGKTLEGGKPTLGGEAREALVPFVVDEMYKGWLDAGGSSVGDVMSGKRFKTGFRGAAKGLPSAVGVPSSTYPKRGARFDISDITEP